MIGRPTAVITGAAGGLGRVLAADLAADGFSLALVGSDEGRLEGLRDELGLDPATTMTVGRDLREAAGAAAVVEAVYERFGRVDALAHLVGGWTGGHDIGSSTDEPFRSMVDQHLWTTLNVVRELAPRMAEAGHGRIVAISSPMAARPAAGQSAYGVGKAAMEALLQGLANELRDRGVTVNVLRVRSIDTSDVPRPEVSKDGATTAAEISAAIRYLFSDAAAAVTGQRINLTRGRS